LKLGENRSFTVGDQASEEGWSSFKSLSVTFSLGPVSQTDVYFTFEILKHTATNAWCRLISV